MATRRNFVTGLAASAAFGALTRGFPAIAQTKPLRIGALISGKDSDNVDELIQPYDTQIRLGLDLAVAEINAAGGILGRQVELVVADDGGSPAPGADAAVKLIRNDGCEALVSGFIIAIRAYLDRTLQQANLNVPVIHACQTEGTYCGRVVHVGATSVQAINALLQYAGNDAKQRTFQMSDWTPSQRTVSRQFYDMVQGGAVGATLSTTPVAGNSPGEFRGAIRWAKDLDARNFWISIPRPYSVNVVKQAFELGFGTAFNFYYLDFSEWHAAQLPAGATVWTALPFVASDDNPAVKDFVARARRKSGGDLVTHVAYTHYNAVQALKAGMEKAGSTAGDKVIGALDGMTLNTPTGAITMGKGRYAAMPIYVARGTANKLDVVKKLDAQAPGAVCT